MFKVNTGKPRKNLWNFFYSEKYEGIKKKLENWTENIGKYSRCELQKIPDKIYTYFANSIQPSLPCQGSKHNLSIVTEFLKRFLRENRGQTSRSYLLHNFIDPILNCLIFCSNRIHNSSSFQENKTPQVTTKSKR